MNDRVKTTLCASFSALTLLLGAGQSFASEPGDFQATLRGVAQRSLEQRVPHAAGRSWRSSPSRTRTMRSRTALRGGL